LHDPVPHTGDRALLNHAMPIYAYKCGSCGFAKDVLQKMSDAPLSTCPSCGADSFTKQVTAAGFQLKGSGWYVTDFRGGSSKGDGAASSEPGSAKSGDAAAPSPNSAAASATPAAAPAAGVAPAAAGKSVVPAAPGGSAKAPKGDA
jgi:putative FmdB family regulatory protein